MRAAEQRRTFQEARSQAHDARERLLDKFQRAGSPRDITRALRVLSEALEQRPSQVIYAIDPAGEGFSTFTHRSLEDFAAAARPSLPAIGPHMTRSDAKTILYAWLFSHDPRQSQAAAQALAEAFPTTHRCQDCRTYVRECTACENPHWIHHERMQHAARSAEAQDVLPYQPELPATAPGYDISSTGKGDPLPDTTARYNALMIQIDEVLSEAP